jgi:hypothetical protein
MLSRSYASRKIRPKRTPHSWPLDYVRVSTYGHMLDAQLEQLSEAGCTKIYREKVTGRRVRKTAVARRVARTKHYAYQEASWLVPAKTPETLARSCWPHSTARAKLSVADECRGRAHARVTAGEQMSRISIGGDAARGTPADTHPVFVQTIAASLNRRSASVVASAGSLSQSGAGIADLMLRPRPLALLLAAA